MTSAKWKFCTQTSDLESFLEWSLDSSKVSSTDLTLWWRSREPKSPWKSLARSSLTWDPILRSSKNEKIRLVVGLAGLLSYLHQRRDRSFLRQKKTPGGWDLSPMPGGSMRVTISWQSVQETDRWWWGALCLWVGCWRFRLLLQLHQRMPGLVVWDQSQPFGLLSVETVGMGRWSYILRSKQNFWSPEWWYSSLYPVFRGLCMGWSWALWLANEAVCFAVAGRVERPLGEIRDRLPAPRFDKGVVTGLSSWDHCSTVSIWRHTFGVVIGATAISAEYSWGDFWLWQRSC